MAFLNTFRRRQLHFAFLVLTTALSAMPAEAAQYSTIYAFGDSLTDAGNVWKATLRTIPISPPYSQGRFTNGPVWLQDMGSDLGIKTIKPSLLGGTDYANGGAQSGSTAVHDMNPFDLPAQLAEFKVNVPHPHADALYVLWIGANDLFAMLDKTLTASQTAKAIGDIVDNQKAFVTAIALGGARHLMLLTSPDLGNTPTISSQGSAKTKAATALSKQYNAALTSKIQSLAGLYGMDLTIVDTFALLDSAIANPARYGFTNVTAPCWTGGLQTRKGKLCAAGISAQNHYLFWDQYHPTAHGHAFIAATAKGALAKVRPLMVSAAQ